MWTAVGIFRYNDGWLIPFDQSCDPFKASAMLVRSYVHDRPVYEMARAFNHRKAKPKAIGRERKNPFVCGAAISHCHQRVHAAEELQR